MYNALGSMKKLFLLPILFLVLDCSSNEMEESEQERVNDVDPLIGTWNYVISDPYTGNDFFKTTFNVSFLTTIFCILLGYPLAYFLSQVPKKLVGIFMITVLLPFWTSLLVRTYAWLVLLQKKGMINNFAIDMGIWETPIKLAHNLNGTLVGMIHIMLPFMVLPLYAAMQRIDRQTMQAASNLGATPIQAFWQIFVPLSLPGVAAGSLIVFILCLGFYVTPAVLGGGKVIMVSMQITAILEDQFNWGAASALGVVLLVTTFIFLLRSPSSFQLFICHWLCLAGQVASSKPISFEILLIILN